MPLDYNTFLRTSQTTKPKEIKFTIDKRKEKENNNMGPGYYQMIENWGCKNKTKKGDVSFLAKVHRRNPSSVYYDIRGSLNS